MAKGTNVVVLSGNLGRDAETRYTPGNTAVTNFSIAVSRSVKRGEEWVDITDWWPVVLWKAEGLAPYLTKGTKVTVQGRLQDNRYEKDGETKHRAEIVAFNVELQGGNRQGNSQGASQGGGASYGGGQATGGGHQQGPAPDPEDDRMPISDDDVPF